jgi:hypothetical protein
MEAIKLNVELTPITCGGCGITFGLPTRVYEARRQDHRNFWCPNGCVRRYVGETEEEKLRRRLKFEQNRRESAEREAEFAERRRRAAKGQVTRMKHRIAHGVCPCCRRTFVNLQRHMATKHPDFEATE